MDSSIINDELPESPPSSPVSPCEPEIAAVAPPPPPDLPPIPGGVPDMIESGEFRRPPPQSLPGATEERAPPRRHVCLEFAIKVWGWAFDIFTVGVNIADIVSDILVAIQFAQDGHTTWFWLVMSSLMISNVIYTVFAVEVMMRENLKWRILRPIQYVLAFPLAQLAPTVNWVLEQVHPSSIHGIRSGDWNLDGDNSTAAVAEETQAIETQNKVMEKLEKALNEHLRTHMLFYLETVVEAIPQSIIQLLAITFLGQATGMQVFSMALSLISIVSKAYVVSHSFTVKMMTFKFMLVAHDIFSLFYIFSTILSKDESKDLRLGDFDFNYLSYIWLIRLFVVVGYAVGSWITIGISLCVEEFYIRRRHLTCEFLKTGVLMILLTVVMAVPAALAIEGAKLIWLILGISNMEPTVAGFPAFSFIFSFVERGDRNERMRYIVKSGIRARIRKQKGPIVHSYRRHSRMPRRVTPAPAAAPARVPDPYDNIYGGVSMAIMPPDGGVVAVDDVSLPQGNMLTEAEQELVDAAEMGAFVFKTYQVCNEQPFNSRNLFWKTVWDKPSIGDVSKECKCGVECAAATGGTIGLIIYTLTQLYAIVFPFVNFGLNHERQNLLQWFCFIALCVSVFFLLILFPSAYSYVWFCLEMTFFKRFHRSDRELPGAARKWIADYHVPPHALILQQSIPHRLIPPDVINIVGEFLTTSQLNLKHLTIQQCAEIRRRMIEPTNARSEHEIDDIVRGNSAVDFDGNQPIASNEPLALGREMSVMGMERELSDVIAI